MVLPGSDTVSTLDAAPVAIKNSFGGLLKEVRHYAHKYMHEVLVDLMMMQKELHPNIFAGKSTSPGI